VRRLDRAQRRSARVCVVLALAAFVIAVIVVRVETVSSLDAGTKSLVRDGRSLALAAPMHAVSLLGSGYVLLPITLAWSVVLWRRGQRTLAVSLPAIGAGAALTLALLKWSVGKPRPTLRGYGFPSGHVFGVTVFVVLAVYLLWAFDAPRRVRRAAQALGILYVLVVGYSRLYVNAHWLSDVGGGLLAGILFALVMMLVMDRQIASSGPSR